jgi:hypothetical protein
MLVLPHLVVLGDWRKKHEGKLVDMSFVCVTGLCLNLHRAFPLTDIVSYMRKMRGSVVFCFSSQYLRK